MGREPQLPQNLRVGLRAGRRAGRTPKSEVSWALVGEVACGGLQAVTGCPLGLAVDGEGALVAVAFGGLAALQARLVASGVAVVVAGAEAAAERPLGAGADTDPEKHPGIGPRAHGGLRAARAALTAYFSSSSFSSFSSSTGAASPGTRGPLDPFRDLPLRPQGTPFQQRAWAALRAIPVGETRSYGEQAATLGSPGASRAVGQANARNPLPIVVPCHRVLGAGRTLGGFSGGLAVKRWLLAHEGVTVAAAAGPGLFQEAGGR